MKGGVLARIALALDLALAPACGALAADAETPDVAVFTLSSIPVLADGAAVYELDRRDRLAARLGAGLPFEPERALAAARRRMDSPEGRELRSDLADAAEGNALAARLGIDRLPAVVVDDRFVVYGVRDVRRALDLVASWRRDNQTTMNSGPGNARSVPHPRTGTPPARSLRRRAQR